MRQKQPNIGNSRRLSGMAGVFAVCERLCRYGYTPFIPSVDSGTDIMLDNGLRLQVKSSAGVKHPSYPLGVYQFSLRMSARAKWRQNAGELQYKSGDGLAHVKASNDFLVLFAIPERRFFIVPADAVNSEMIYIVPKDSPVLDRVKNPSQSTLGRRLMGYEEAWHLLDVDAAVEATVADVSEEVTI